MLNTLRIYLWFKVPSTVEPQLRDMGHNKYQKKEEEVEK